ncbi:unnamed protein product [Gongylonema pulchrum]|uniref:CCR4-NOT transcription complex subunit 9 n=1 Tax=Gongylonema pulchrum TaxID=637853 RepID=A0A183CXP8_9BILA|nr:unnamed protein product [Gongylonema pulchrum]
MLSVIEEREQVLIRWIEKCETNVRRVIQDGLKIQEATFKCLLKRIDDKSWAIKYAVGIWFSDCLGTYRVAIPETLSKLLTDEKLQTLKVEKTGDDDDGSDQSVFVMLFELATIHPSLAIDMLKVIRNHPNFTRRKIASMFLVVRAIVNYADIFRETVPLLTEISQSVFEGLRLAEPILIMQEAVLCAIHYDREDSDTTAVPFSHLEFSNEVAVKLLQTFCDLAHDHMEKEMVDLRRNHVNSESKT